MIAQTVSIELQDRSYPIAIGAADLCVPAPRQ